MEARSQSSSDLLMSLLGGKVTKGVVLTGNELRFGDYVVALTPVGAPRLPNGIECSIVARARAPVTIGEGRVTLGRLEITPGTPWNPVPTFEPIDCLPPGLEPFTTSAAGRIEGADEGSAALLAGYAAGLVLLHRQRAKGQLAVARAIQRFGPSAATLLRHAARGEVPEPVHTMLTTGDAGRLIASSPAGIAWLRGFLSAGLPLDVAGARVALGRRSA